MDGSCTLVLRPLDANDDGATSEVVRHEVQHGWRLQTIDDERRFDGGESSVELHSCPGQDERIATLDLCHGANAVHVDRPPERSNISPEHMCPAQRWPSRSPS